MCVRHGLSAFHVFTVLLHIAFLILFPGVSYFSLTLLQPIWSMEFFLKTFLFGCGSFLKSLLNLLHYCFCFMFWFFDCEAHGIVFPWPGIKSAPPALEGIVLTTGLPEKSFIKSWSNTWTILNLEYLPPVILSSPSNIDSNVTFTEKFSFQSFYLNLQLPNASCLLPFPISMHVGLSWWLSM